MREEAWAAVQLMRRRGLNPQSYTSPGAAWEWWQTNKPAT